MKIILCTLLLWFMCTVSVLASPTRPNNTGPTDVDLLQYLLTIEHLQAAFYQEALGKFSTQSFTSAGFPSFVFGRIAQIHNQDAQHVQFLQQELINLRVVPTQQCNYSFGLTTVHAFTSTASALEGASVSAYLGVEPLIHDTQFITKTASIFGVEARQSAFLDASVNKGSPWNAAYETSLGLSAAFSLFSGYIVNCPSSNPTLPVRDLPKLTIGNQPTPGGTIVVSVAGNARRQSQDQNVVFFSGTNVIHSPLRNGAAQVPQNLQGEGTVYVAVTTSESGTPSDDQLVSGASAFSSTSSSES